MVHCLHISPSTDHRKGQETTQNYFSHLTLSSSFSARPRAPALRWTDRPVLLKKNYFENIFREKIPKKYAKPMIDLCP